MAMENQKDRRVFNLVNSTPDIGPPVARPAASHSLDVSRSAKTRRSCR